VNDLNALPSFARVLEEIVNYENDVLFSIVWRRELQIGIYQTVFKTKQMASRVIL